MPSILRDLRYAVRQLRGHPAFTSVALLTLAIGIGATTAMFSVVDAVLLRSLGFEGSERLVSVFPVTASTGESALQVSYPTMTDIAGASHTLTATGGFRYWISTLAGGDLPESMLSVYLTEGMPRTLRVTPAEGRWFSAGSDTPGRAAEVVLSDGAWRTRFHADHTILGRSVMIDGKPTTIVGILQPGFRFPDLVPENVTIPSREPDLYLPAGLAPDDLAARGNTNFWMVGRLADGVTLQAAGAELRRIAADLATRYPRDYPDQTLGVTSLKSEIVGGTGRPLLVLLAAVGLVLVIACANVAGLMLARAAVRRREFALRTALGAGPWSLVRQVLIESLVLGVTGGMLGALLGSWGVELIRVTAPNTIPRIAEVRVDGTVLAFTVLVSVVSGVLFGLAPALAGGRRAPAEALHEGGRSIGHRGRLRDVLVVGQVALAVVLLSSAGLLLRSFAAVLRAEPGFDGHHVLTLLTVLPPTRYPDEASQVRYAEAAIARLRELPEVTSAGLVNTVPLSNLGGSTWVRLPGQPEDEAPISVPYRTVAGSYFDALHLKLAAGRYLTEQDGPGAPAVALVSVAAARRMFGEADPVGHAIRLGNDPGPRTVVGVVQDVRDVALDQPAPPMVYYPFAQRPEAVFTLVVRTVGEPEGAARAVRQQLATVDPGLAMFLVRTMDELVDSTLQRRRFHLALLSGFAATALIMAAIGLYGLISYTLTQRTREIGIRLALGAAPSAIRRLVLRDGGRLAIGGALLGLGGSLAAARLLRSQLVDVAPVDPVALGGTVALLLVVCLLAVAIPARRAAALDPLLALRED